MEGPAGGLNGELVEQLADDAGHATRLPAPLFDLAQQALSGWQRPSTDEHTG